ncbi:hypothetical protein Cgig2_006242 [Carnegiea gigantea]|uniref:Uncharacterized protein n=1 Tax=Carnegiea gigantea TaxID=171969 RepID=A0A9Q1JIH3_9CARY|nr:hypothetical protein Cgig2_006242 [Carnegiea gigantea]
MSTMNGTIMQQVSEHVKKAMEAASSARPLSRFEYIPIAGCEPSHKHAPMASHHHREGMREAPHDGRNGRSRAENRDRSVRAEALPSHCPSNGRPVKLTTASMPHATHSQRTTWFEEQGRPPDLEERPQGDGQLQNVTPTVSPAPLCFGDEAKARTLEVDFLVIDVPTAYNVILGRPTLHKRAKGLERKTTKSKQKHPRALGIGIFIVVATLSGPDLIALLTKSRSLVVQRRSILIAQVIFIYGRQVKLHQLRVLTRTRSVTKE